MNDPVGDGHEYTVRYHAIVDLSDWVRQHREALRVLNDVKKGTEDVTQADRKRTQSTKDWEKAYRDATKVAQEHVRTQSTEANQQRLIAYAQALNIGNFNKETQARREANKETATSANAYEQMRREITASTNAVHELGTESTRTEGRLQKTASVLQAAFSSARSGGEHITPPTPTNRISNPFAGMPQYPQFPEPHDDPMLHVNPRREESTTVVDDISAPLNAGRQSADELSEAIKRIGQSTDKTSGKTDDFISHLRSSFGRGVDSAKDLGDEVDKVIPNRRRSTGDADFPGPFRRRSDSGGGGGGRGGGGGGGSGGFNIGGGSNRSTVRVLGQSFGTTEAGSLGILAAKIAGIGAAIAPVIALLGSFGGAALAAANTAASLGGAVAALPGFFAAAASGIGAVMVAMGPMSNIFKLFQAQQKAVGMGALEQAANQKEAADKVRDATHAQEQAQNALTEAQFDAGRAQDNLNQAVRKAKLNLQDLRMENERNALSQEGATLGLARAEAEYKKTLADPNATLLDRAEALHRVKEAQLAERDAKVKNNRGQQELNDAEKRGVALNRDVIDATHARDQALRSVAEAQYNLSKSVTNLNKALEEQKHGGAAGLKAWQQLQDALNSASPSTRKVAEGILAMNDAWKNIQKNVSEAVFAPIVGQLGNMKSLLPVIENLLIKAGDAMGKVAAKGIEMVSSGPWKADFATLADSSAKIIGSLGDAALSVADAFRNITIAALPFTEWIADAIKRTADGFAKWSEDARKSGGIADFLETTKDRISQLWRVVKNVGLVFASIYTATKPFTDWFLDQIEKLTETWKAWGKGAEKDGSPFRKWLEDIKPLILATGGLVGDLVKGIAKIAADPKNIQAATHLLTTLKTDVLPPLIRMIQSLGQSGILEKVGEVLGKIFDVIANFLEKGGSQGLSSFVDTLSVFVSGLAGILKIPGVIPILGGITAALGVLAAFRVATKLPLISQLIDGLGWLVRNKSGFSGILRDLPGLLKDAFSAGNLRNVVLKSLGLGALVPSGSGNRSGGSGRDSDGRNFPGRDGWYRKGQTPTSAIYVIPVGGRGFGNDQGNGTTPDVDLDENGRPRIDEHGRPIKSHRKPSRFGGVKRGAGGLLGGVAESLGLDWLSNLFGGGSDVPDVVDPANNRPITEPTKVPTKPPRVSRIKPFIEDLKPSLNPRSLAINAAIAAGVYGTESFIGSKLSDKNRDRFEFGTGALQNLASDPNPLMFGFNTLMGLKDNKTVRKDIGGVAGNAWKGLQTVAGGVGQNLGLDKAWDGAYEGFMKKVGSPIADWFRKLPELGGKLKDFFTNLPAQILESIGAAGADIEDFVKNGIPEFFHETLPHWWDNLTDSLKDAWEGAKDFLTTGVGTFMYKTIPHWFSSIGSAIGGVWNKQVVPFLTTGVGKFMYTVIPHWWSSLSSAFRRAFNGVFNFMTKDVGIFMYKTIPGWFENIPDLFKKTWKNVMDFLTKDVGIFVYKTLPHWLSGLGDDILDAIVTPFKDFFGPVWDFIKEHIGKGYEKEKAKRKADRGYEHGGVIEGTFTGRQDDTNIRATPGEFMINRADTQKPGSLNFLRDYNEGKYDPIKLENVYRLTVDDLLGNLSVMAAPISLPMLAPTSSSSLQNINQDNSRKIENLNVAFYHREDDRPERTLRKTLRDVVDGDF